jgi:hypothetical protein
MGMRIDTRYDSDLYFRIRNGWCLSKEGTESAWEGNWSKDFPVWLKKNGARIETDWMDPLETYVADGCGMVLGKEHIVFDNEEDYTMFLLRWL